MYTGLMWFGEFTVERRVQVPVGVCAVLRKIRCGDGRRACVPPAPRRCGFDSPQTQGQPDRLTDRCMCTHARARARAHKLSVCPEGQVCQNYPLSSFSSSSLPLPPSSPANLFQSIVITWKKNIASAHISPLAKSEKNRNPRSFGVG